MDLNNDWKHELSHMLDVIEKQSTASLAKINRQFKALNLPFDENLRQDIVKMTNFRFVVALKRCIFPWTFFCIDCTD